MTKTIKKCVSALALVVLTALMCTGLAACGVKAESITLSQSEVSLQSKGTQELTYTVQPENAKVKIEISDKTVVKYENNTLTALTAGEATVKVCAANGEVYGECAVTVSAPEGYTAYTYSGCKFVYPSSWKKSSAAGTAANFTGSGNSSVNLVTESKNTAYFRASADTFKNTLVNSYSGMGYTATFTNCTVDKSDYLGYTRVHVVYDYTLSRGTVSAELHQEQMILNSGNNTYILTVSYNASNLDQSQTDTVFSEFVGIK